MARKTNKIVFAEVPAWAIDTNETPTRYTIAATFAVSGLTDRWVRLTAPMQRLIFGAYLFGKCEMLVNNDGIKVTRSVCFGTDFSVTRHDWPTVEDYIRHGTRPIL